MLKTRTSVIVLAPGEVNLQPVREVARGAILPAAARAPVDAPAVAVDCARDTEAAIDRRRRGGRPGAGRGDVAPTRAATGGAASPAMASTSAMRLRMSDAPVTSTRMRAVVRAGKVTVRQTFWLPVMVPPGTASHCAPSQYWTVKLVTPYCENSLRRAWVRPGRRSCPGC